MLNYISRYTPPLQAQAPKVINSQRSGMLPAFETIERMGHCRELSRQLEAAVNANRPPDEIEILQHMRNEALALLPALEIEGNQYFPWEEMVMTHEPSN